MRSEIFLFNIQGVEENVCFRVFVGIFGTAWDIEPKFLRVVNIQFSSGVDSGVGRTYIPSIFYTMFDVPTAAVFEIDKVHCVCWRISNFLLILLYKFRQYSLKCAKKVVFFCQNLSNFSRKWLKNLTRLSFWRRKWSWVIQNFP